MAERVVVDEVAANEARQTAELTAGFAEDKPPVTAAVSEAAPVVETKTAQKVEQKPAPKDAKAEVTPPAPKYVQITQEQWDALQSSAAKVDGVDKRIRDTLAGSLGEIEQRIVKKLQTATPTGMTVELPADVVAEMEKDFPEIAGHFKTALTKALRGIRGTGGAGAAAGIDPDELNKLVSETIPRITRETFQKAEAQSLSDAHPNWREIVGSVDSEGKYDPANPYRAWLAKQDQAYQNLINSTDSSVVISKSIDKFKAASKAAPKSNTPAPKVVDRRAITQAAIQPKGDGGQPAPRKTMHDEFLSGFNGQ